MEAVSRRLGWVVFLLAVIVAFLGYSAYAAQSAASDYEMFKRDTRAIFRLLLDPKHPAIGESDRKRARDMIWGKD